MESDTHSIDYKSPNFFNTHNMVKISDAHSTKILNPTFTRNMKIQNLDFEKRKLLHGNLLNKKKKIQRLLISKQKEVLKIDGKLLCNDCRNLGLHKKCMTLIEATRLNTYIGKQLFQQCSECTVGLKGKNIISNDSWNCEFCNQSKKKNGTGSIIKYCGKCKGYMVLFAKNFEQELRKQKQTDDSNENNKKKKCVVRKKKDITIMYQIIINN